MNMTKRRLVKLMGNTGFYAEVDIVKLKRLAMELLNYIQINISQDDDEYEIWKWVVPMCKAVLDGTIQLPVPFVDLPLNYPMREGLLPPDFQKKFSEFRVAACAMILKFSEKIMIDGVAYMYADFEE
ncbi:hypothetical protein IV454_15530 [Massilia antarctica]|uniref:Uncharacterized protein n=1 Tax=Massilia antarctica TaxID=2765360 RepID=A0AA48WI62_9BURK|nr:hypothetical protein [Massilia antarctica]QPI52767.1 hypothetical protein IV454_15530 [Massilia antarctica]